MLWRDFSCITVLILRIRDENIRLGCQTFVTNGDISLSWDEETRKQVVKRKPDKLKPTAEAVK